ncbi:MAG: phosphoserine phosphatase RsbU/P [Blastocatellia bacterium]|jgi:sigma-B regulation protein RsbU (phosphoserine phosphatase)|nr:phosphoserine phosphatase RsbU/P [Blastocatellia bacterium]
MVLKQSRIGQRIRSVFAMVWTRLRRVMPTIAMIGMAMFVVWLGVRKTAVYREFPIFGIYGFATACLCCFTAIYYSARGIRWLKRRLLWRVRRRLLITYLFVGVTPIVLLVLLGALAWIAVSNEAMSRILTAQISGTERDVTSMAKAVAESYSHQPRMDDRAAQQWLDEQVRFLNNQIPGARIVLWRPAATGPKEDVVHGPRLFSQAADTTETQPFQPDEGLASYQIPHWLSPGQEWSGIAFIPPPEDSSSVFGSPSFRSLVAGWANGAPFHVMLIAPMNPAYLSRLEKNTGLTVRPFFVVAGYNRFKMGTRNRESIVKPSDETGNSDAELEHFTDQTGKPIRGTVAPVFVSSTNWLTGDKVDTMSLIFEWSWAAAQKHILEGGIISDVFKKLLLITGVTFLLLELFALLSAAWMTRAVTGTVHKLYNATKFINQGDFSHRVTVRSHDQLGELASAFNEMSSNIELLLKERVERERLQREVEIAAEVQAQLFPALVPPLKSVELSAECRAARGVAGDYYDYVEIRPGLVAIALGDVSGKGISASLVMSNLQASLRAQSSMMAERLKESMQVATTTIGVRQSESLPVPGGLSANSYCCAERIVGNINNQLCGSTGTNRFATLVVGLYDDQTRSMQYTNAGHNPPILVRSGGTVERLTEGGMMVGAFDWAEYDQDTVRIGPGDTLLIFSDGLSEAASITGEEYGEERLAQLVIANRHLPADELRRTIFAEIEHWSGALEPADDQTLVIVKSKGSLAI